MIAPTYAHSAFIRECLLSVVSQTFEDWELLVMDDSSPDDTLAQARTVADPRIRVISLPHVGLEGLAETYNAGLAESRGTLIAAIEGDDRWVADKLAHQVAIMQDPRIVLTYARYGVFGTHGRVLSTPPLAGPASGTAFDALGSLLQDSFIELITTMMRRDDLIAAGGFRQLPRHAHVDYATFLALAERGPFFASDTVLAHWRRHTGSSTVQAVTAPQNFEGPGICRALALQVRRAHPERVDLPSEAAIVASWSNVLARRYWNSGRILQAQRQWGAARNLFLTGLRIGSASLQQRVLLAAGGLASLVHLDIERFVGLVRRNSPLTDL